MQMQQDQRYRADAENIIAAKERTARLEVVLRYREQQLQAEREAPAIAAQNVKYSMLSTPTIPHIEQQVRSPAHTTTHTSQPLLVTEPIDLTVTTPTTDSFREDTAHSSTLASYKHAQLMREDAAYYRHIQPRNSNGLGHRITNTTYTHQTHTDANTHSLKRTMQVTYAWCAVSTHSQQAAKATNHNEHVAYNYGSLWFGTRLPEHWI